MGFAHPGESEARGPSRQGLGLVKSGTKVGGRES
jgi:hypothetical protein